MPSNPNLLNGLRAFWKLSETSGTRADSTGSFDLSETGGTLTGANFSPQFNSAQFCGPAVSNDGSLIGLTRASASDLLIGTTDMSVCFWFLLTSYPANNSTFIGKWAFETSGFEWTVNYGAPTTGLFASIGYGSDGSGAEIKAAIIPQSGNSFTRLNTWYFVAARFRPVNGVIQISLNNSNTWTTTRFDYSTAITGVSRFAVGARCTSAGVISNTLTGRMTNVGIWSRLLNDYEVGDLWNGGNGLDYSFSF